MNPILIYMIFDITIGLIGVLTNFSPKDKDLGVYLTQCLMCGLMKELEDTSHCSECLDRYAESKTAFRNG